MTSPDNQEKRCFILSIPPTDGHAKICLCPASALVGCLKIIRCTLRRSMRVAPLMSPRHDVQRAKISSIPSSKINFLSRVRRCCMAQDLFLCKLEMDWAVKCKPISFGLQTFTTYRLFTFGWEGLGGHWGGG